MLWIRSFVLGVVAVGLPGGPARLATAEEEQQPGIFRINDTDVGSSLRYTDRWMSLGGEQPRGGSLHYANAPGESVELTFRGTRVDLIHRVSPEGGIAKVFVDGKPTPAGQIDMYSPSIEWNHRTPLAENLPRGEHTLRLEVTGRKHEAATGTYILVVGFDVDDPEWNVRIKQAEEARRVESERRLGPRMVQCPPIAFVKRHHFRSPGAGGVLLCWDVFRRGGGIFTCDPKHPEAGEKEIFGSADGVVFDMSLSYDATRLLFSWMDLSEKGKDSFHVYEIGIDGSGLRQLTEGRFHDVSPVYLPDGKIGFVSTRVESFSMCQDAAASAMHVMEADGSAIRRIQFGTLADFSPYVLDDGSILFTRWEYQDKSVFSVQSLWTINPDGTRLNLFYGNTITVPNTIWQAKPIPGTSKMVCTMAPHHRNLVGAIGILDRQVGVENPQALVNITPEIPYQPTNDPSWQPGDRLFYWSYRDPYPIDRDLFLVAYGGGGLQRYRIHLLDERGDKMTLWEDPDISCFHPVPLAARSHPHVAAQHVASDEGYGTFLLTDVYRGLNGVPRGSVKQLRVMTQVPKPTNNRGARAYFMGHDIVDPVIGAGTFYVKYNCGTVPVEEDGSAYFKAPAGRELYFQALDAEGMELSRMGSFTQLMPGENQSCIGCHESPFMAPPHRASTLRAIDKGPVDITPPPWGAGPVDFVTQVQPVLDRYCVDCHGGINPDGGIDLSGDKTRHFNMAYDNLVQRQFVQFFYLTPPQEETGSFLPLTTGSRVSRMAELIHERHGEVEVDPTSRQRIYAWIEANIPYYGTYEHTRPGTSGSRDAWAGAWSGQLAEKFNARCTGCHDKLDLIANRHSTWVNLTSPELSRVLSAPLAQSAGGLGLCQTKDGNQPRGFADTADPDYQAMLGLIRQGHQNLYKKPRIDMAGAQPAPYPQDFGHLFRGGGR